MTDTAASGALDDAARRLTAAVEGLERRLGMGADATGELFLSSAFDADRQRLADELDQAQARVRVLETAAAEAAEAVGRAVADIRSRLRPPAAEA